MLQGTRTHAHTLAEPAARYGDVRGPRDKSARCRTVKPTLDTIGHTHDVLYKQQTSLGFGQTHARLWFEPCHEDHPGFFFSSRRRHTMFQVDFFFFKQKTAYEITR